MLHGKASGKGHIPIRVPARRSGQRKFEHAPLLNTLPSRRGLLTGLRRRQQRGLKAGSHGRGAKAKDVSTMHGLFLTFDRLTADCIGSGIEEPLFYPRTAASVNRDMEVNDEK
jgi:hypothetical protein